MTMHKLEKIYPILRVTKSDWSDPIHTEVDA